MTDPTTATNPPNPQDLIDQALGDMGAATPTPVEPTPTPTPTEPTALPPLEPLAPTEVAADTAVASSGPVVAETPKSEDVMPAELTESVEQSPEPMPESGSETINNLDSIEAKGEDVPLALVGAQPPEASPIASAPVVEPVNPVVPPALTGMMNEEPKPKKKGKKVVGVLVGILAFLGLVGIGGLVSYQMYGTEAGLIAYITKWVEVDGKIVKNPDYQQVQDQGGYENDDGEWVSSYQNEVERAQDLGLEAPSDPNQNTSTRGTDAGSCGGCFNNQWQVWQNGECRLTGSCGTGVAGKDTPNPNVESANTESACASAGGTWCAATDLSNRSYAFCNGTPNTTCQTAASEKGYTVLKGAVICKANEAGTGWEADDAKIDYYWDGDNGAPFDPVKLEESKQDVDKHCNDQFKKVCPTPDAATCNVGFGSGDFICQVGKVGSGGEVYQAGQACTAANGFPFNGSLGCFCGVVQMDTPMGHTSYSSTCGCDKTEGTTPNPSTPTITTNPTLMCDSITRAPNTTVSLGDTLTFTCVGSSSPAGSVNLSYKFRYSVNSGAYTVLANKTATTAEMTVAACGSYKVQCQACGTINGTLVCDPVWSGATTQ